MLTAVASFGWLCLVGCVTLYIHDVSHVMSGVVDRLDVAAAGQHGHARISSHVFLILHSGPAWLSCTTCRQLGCAGVPKLDFTLFLLHLSRHFVHVSPTENIFACARAMRCAPLSVVLTGWVLTHACQRAYHILAGVCWGLTLDYSLDYCGGAHLSVLG